MHESEKRATPIHRKADDGKAYHPNLAPPHRSGSADAAAVPSVVAGKKEESPRDAILEAVKAGNHDIPTISELIGKGKGATRHLLDRMAAAGTLTKTVTRQGCVFHVEGQKTPVTQKEAVQRRAGVQIKNKPEPVVTEADNDPVSVALARATDRLRANPPNNVDLKLRVLRGLAQIHEPVISDVLASVIEDYI